MGGGKARSGGLEEWLCAGRCAAAKTGRVSTRGSGKTAANTEVAKTVRFKRMAAQPSRAADGDISARQKNVCVHTEKKK